MSVLGPGPELSSIATSTAVPASALPALARAARRGKSLLGGLKDEFPTALARYGRALEVLDPSGEPLSTALVYLQRLGFDLTRSRHQGTAKEISLARGSTYLVLGEEHLAQAPVLEEARHPVVELTAFFNAFHRTGDGIEVGEKMGEAIGFLRRALEAVTPGTVVLVAML